MYCICQRGELFTASPPPAKLYWTEMSLQLIFKFFFLLTRNITKQEEFIFKPFWLLLALSARKVMSLILIPLSVIVSFTMSVYLWKAAVKYVEWRQMTEHAVKNTAPPRIYCSIALFLIQLVILMFPIPLVSLLAVMTELKENKGSRDRYQSRAKINNRRSRRESAKCSKLVMLRPFNFYWQIFKFCLS